MFNKIFNKKLSRNLSVAFLLTVSQLSFAQVASDSHSIGQLKNNAPENAQSKIELMAKETQEVKIKSAQRNMSLKGMNRADVILARKKQSKPGLLSSVSSDNVQSIAAVYYSFSIYTAYSQLIADIDEDGYFQSFSVSFDADILSPMAHEQAFVYADLYLSQNGGPWLLYFSTDGFTITGEDSDDEFEVVTQLDSGYVPEHYDVLIDLYEVGYGEVVATYSSNDSNALYALPLESSDYDIEYIAVEDEYYHAHGGGSLWLLFSTLIVLGYRGRNAFKL